MPTSSAGRMVIWFGYGLAPKVLMAFLFAFFPVVIQAMAALAGTPLHLLEHFRAIRAPARTRLRRLQVPAASPATTVSRTYSDVATASGPEAAIGSVQKRRRIYGLRRLVTCCNHAGLAGRGCRSDNDDSRLP